MTTIQWQPFRESLSVTLGRNVTIAVAAGAVWARWSGGISRWPLLSLLLLWPTLGGHVLDQWFLNWLRPRISATRAAQVWARLAVWFAGGTLLAAGMALSAITLTRFHPPPWWWLAGGIAFIGVELVAQLFLQLRGRPSFFNGRG